MIADVSTAVVTGGGHGIGAALCRRLAKDNIKVIVADLDEAAAQAVAAEIDGVAFKVDVGDEAEMTAMIKRGGGYLVNTASAAGLLSSIGDAAYSVTKHAAVGFAEAVAIRHGDEDIKVSVVCPQAVATRMLDLAVGPGANENVFAGADADGILTPEQVADCIVDGVANSQFLIVPHPEVLGYFQRKAADYDRWINGMRRYRRKLSK